MRLLPWGCCRAAAGLAAACLLAACGKPGFGSHEDVGRYLEAVTHAPLPIRAGSYLGVYEPGVPRREDRVQRFTARTRRPNLLLYYSNWGAPFSTSFADWALARGAVPVVQLDPGRASLRAIAQGQYDSYLDTFASEVRAYGRPVVIGFAREMNGDWYPWGAGRLSPQAWIAAWRHVVTTFRKAHADNVTWQWTINAQGHGIVSPAAWWPGSSYVTWIGIDGYYYSRADTFARVFRRAVLTVRRLTGDPIVLSEVGMSPKADPVAQMPRLFAGIRQDHLLGLVWFDAHARQDWRLEDNPRALAAFRRQAATLVVPRRD